MSHNLKMSVDKTRHLRDVCIEILQHLGEHANTMDAGLAEENIRLRGQVEALTERLVLEREKYLTLAADRDQLAQRVTASEGALYLVSQWVDDQDSRSADMGYGDDWAPCVGGRDTLCEILQESGVAGIEVRV